MPKKVSQKLKDAIYEALKDPGVINGVKAMGFRCEPLYSEEFSKKAKEFDATVKMITEQAKIPRE
jgi:tripartite-type tricarboxylate transporter receptor subunit TctC